MTVNEKLLQAALHLVCADDDNRLGLELPFYDAQRDTFYATDGRMAIQVTNVGGCGEIAHSTEMPKSLPGFFTGVDAPVDGMNVDRVERASAVAVDQAYVEHGRPKLELVDGDPCMDDPADGNIVLIPGGGLYAAPRLNLACRAFRLLNRAGGVRFAVCGTLKGGIGMSSVLRLTSQDNSVSVVIAGIVPEHLGVEVVVVDASTLERLNEEEVNARYH